MSRDPQYFLDILEAAKLAQRYIAGKTQEEFLQDTLCQDAVIRRLEIIGEAARRFILAPSYLARRCDAPIPLGL